MGTTPNYNIQYPDSGDQWDLINDLQALADTTDTAIDGVQSNVDTVATNATNASNLTSGTVGAARLPNLQDLNGTLDIASGGTGATTVAAAQTALSISVIQIVQGSTTTMVSNSTTTPVATGLTATITPKYADSKILVLVNQNGLYKSNDSASTAVRITLMRGATSLMFFGNVSGSNVASNWGGMSVGGAYLDSPGTTSAVTYNTTLANNVNSASVEAQSVSARSTIVLMEVKQ